jgi:hypothetical protein
MLLSHREREFLSAFIYEATTDPFKGPATEELHKRNIYYTDLSNLLAAYYQEKPSTQEGFGGKHIVPLPPCRWEDRHAVVDREQELEAARTANQANL